MTNNELANIALYMARKGYTDYDDVRYCDDLYHATTGEKDTCLDYMGELMDIGITAFAEKHE